MNLIDILLAGSDHEDGNIEPFAQTPTHLEPVETRQHQIEEHQVETVGEAKREPRRAVGGDLHLHARRRKVVTLDEGDGLVIFYDENACHGLTPPLLGREARTTAM